jgi:hypothetical protein
MNRLAAGWAEQPPRDDSDEGDLSNNELMHVSALARKKTRKWKTFLFLGIPALTKRGFNEQLGGGAGRTTAA